MNKAANPSAIRDALKSADALVGKPVVADMPKADIVTPGFTIAEPPPETPEEIVARLAALDPVAYDRVRSAEAEALGCRVATLDAQVATRRAARSEAATDSLLPTHEPWPEPVALGPLLDDLAQAVRRHVVLGAATADCVALWAAHTWVYGGFRHTPRLTITSPSKRCGKSTLLDVLAATCCRPLRADNISAAGTFRIVEALAPVSLLLDEAESFLAENEELRGVLNSGFAADGAVVRVVEIAGEHKPARFRTFAPVALAAIGEVPGTIEDRAVPVVLQRKTAAERVEQLRAPGARERLHAIGRRLARWAVDDGASLGRNPNVPDTLGDREGDISVPLLAIADAAAGEWPRRARAALLAVFGERAGREGTAEAGAMLLADIRGLFADTGTHRLGSADLVERLGAMEERPWAEWRHGKPMTAPQLARALRPFGVRPINYRVPGDGRVSRGYQRDHFGDAWGRYLPAESTNDTPPPPKGGVQTATPLQLRNSAGFSDIRSATSSASVAERSGEKSAENQHCSGVAVSNPPEGAREAWEGVI